MNELKVLFHGQTDIGKKRENNEDTFIAEYIWDKRHILLVVIDGMGGEEGGEIAANIARNTIIKYLKEFQDDTVLNLIKRAVADANNEIIRQKEVQPQLNRMGCVATAGIIDLDEETLSIAHVGDTRLYRYSGGELTKLTHDHSLVGYQEEQGVLTEEQAMKHPRRSVIERCLGSDRHLADDKYFIEGSIFPLISGEIFLFCSDGLCDMLLSKEILDTLLKDETPETECSELIEKANQKGGKDNITVVIAQVVQCEGERKVSHTLKDEIIKENNSIAENEPGFRWKQAVISLIILVIIAFLGLYFNTHDKSYGTKTEPTIIHKELPNRETTPIDTLIPQFNENADTGKVSGFDNDEHE